MQNMKIEKVVNTFLNVEKSLKGFSWRILEVDDSFVESISQKFNIPDIIARVLVNRDIAVEEVESFLNPKVKNLLPNPFLFKDMDNAVDRIVKAVKNNEKIGIFGDYDVDGATSSAVFYKFFKEIGVDNIEVHIPDRETEGYGLNVEYLKKFKEQGCSLVISVDCGINGFAALDWADKEKLDVIVVDHHEMEAKLPKALAIVDPKRIDDNTLYNYFAAVGVVFLVVVAVNQRLREGEYYKKNNIDEPDLISFLDLVALGTVCDVVPLVGVNRAFVTAGLQILEKRQNVGLKALCDIAKVNTKPNVYHLGYILGPRINAGGRVGNSSVGVKLLCAKNPITAEGLAKKLNDYNEERKQIENYVLLEALDNVDEVQAIEDNLVFVTGKNWHTGVIGIIAGRLKERYNLPVCVATEESEGVFNGSVRSIPTVDIGRIIINAREKGILIEGGGHSMAAGFTYKKEKENEFKNYLKSCILEQLNGENVKPILLIDSVVDVGAINLKTAEKISLLSPFGVNNEEPRFAILNARLSKSNLVGGGHIKCFFNSDNGGSVTVMSFRAEDTEIGEVLLSHIGKVFNLVGRIRANEWNGKKTVQFVLEDAVVL